jgi:hypothetical protein
MKNATILSFLCVCLVLCDATNSGINVGLNSDSVTGVIQDTLPALILAYLCKDYGSFNADIHKWPLESMSFTNFTLGFTLFDHANSGATISDPADLAIKIAGINSTISFGYEVKLWLGHLKGSAKFLIKNADISAKAAFSEVDGAPQLSIPDVDVSLGDFTAELEGGWFERKLVDIGIGYIKKHINSILAKVVKGMEPGINASLKKLPLDLKITDDMAINLHLVSGPAISGKYLYAGLDGTVYNPSGGKTKLTPSAMPTAFQYSLDLLVGQYVLNTAAE